MATISKEIAEEIMAGQYDTDLILPVKIVQYINRNGTESYGVIFEGENPERYAASEYVKNPKVMWLRELGRIE